MIKLIGRLIHADTQESVEVAFEVDKIEMSGASEPLQPEPEPVPEPEPEPPAPEPEPEPEPEPTEPPPRGDYLDPWEGPEPTATTPEGRLIDAEPMERPSVDTWRREPEFGNVIRALPHGVNQGFMHDYSQLQPFSWDDRYMLVMEPGGSRKVLDLETWAFVRSVEGSDLTLGSAPRWQGSGHKIIWLENNPGRVMRIDLDDPYKRTEEIFRFPYTYVNQQNRSFEELSRGGVMMPFWTQEQGGHLGIVDLIQGVMLLDVAMSAVSNRSEAPDWVGVTPAGGVMIVQWQAHGTGLGEGCWAIDLSGQPFAQLHPHSHHSDLGVVGPALGHLVTRKFTGPDGGGNFPWLVSHRLSGETLYHRCIAWDRAWHVSCQGPRNQALITAGTLYQGPFAGELYILDMETNRVRRLLHHRHMGTTGDADLDYFAQPKATWSRTGKLVAFASNWNGEGYVGGYVARIVD